MCPLASEPFQFEVDHARRFLRITLQGGWGRDTVDHYREAVRRTVQTMAIKGVRLDDVAILLDTRDLSVQTRDVAEYYAETPIYAAAQPRRIATLVTSRLVGMQVRRVSTRVEQVFDDEAEALTWLLDA